MMIYPYTPPLSGPRCYARNGWMTMALAALCLQGCAVLPSGDTKMKSSWDSYQMAKESYTKVIEGHTRVEELKRLGYDPATVPNIRVLNYVDVANLFGSAFRPEDLPEGVITCVRERDDCTAYVVDVQNSHSKRVGNVMADLLGFRKRTQVHGWRFQATLVMVDDVVVYKLWNGTPMTESFENQRTPLGPLQNVGSMLPKPGF